MFFRCHKMMNFSTEMSFPVNVLLLLQLNHLLILSPTVIATATATIIITTIIIITITIIIIIISNRLSISFKITI